MRTMAGTAYAEAGVDVARGELLVERLRERIGRVPDLLGTLGGFAAALELPVGLEHPVLVTAADGVGTKTEIARRMGRLDTIGRDLVAMCADDVVCHGARPVWFLDYVAVGRLEPGAVERIVGGIADACDEIGCQLVGGETAEHPGVMATDAFDLAGFCVGVVERADLLDGSLAQATDAIIGLASSGLHANGYSLVRALIGEHDRDLDAPFGPGRNSLGEALLEPTRLYTPAILALRGAVERNGGRLSGVAHITGGGLRANLPRAVGPELAVEVHPGSWPTQPIFDWLADRAGLSGPELRETFNGGIGMAVMVDPGSVDLALATLDELGHDAWQIGRVVGAGLPAADRYVERNA